MKRQYSIYAAKAKLSEIIRHVKRRGRVTITERGKPVAWVVPIPGEEQSLQDRLSELQEGGFLLTASDRPANLRAITKLPGALKRFLESRD